MSVTVDEAYVRKVWTPTTEGRFGDVFSHVKPDVQWHVTGTHACSGHYSSREAFFKGTLGRIQPRLGGTMRAELRHVLVNERREACIELHITGVQKDTKKPFENDYLFVVFYAEDGMVEKGRSYMDGRVIDECIKENQGP